MISKKDEESRKRIDERLKGRYHKWACSDPKCRHKAGIDTEFCMLCGSAMIEEKLTKDKK